MDTQHKEASQNARNRRFTIAAAVSLVCALIVGVLALTLPAVAQTDSDGSGEESDQDQPAAEKGTIGAAVTERLNTALEPLVTAGTITAEQRDAVVEALLSARRSETSDGFKRHRGRLDAEARVACVAALEAHLTARVNGDQPGDDANSERLSQRRVGVRRTTAATAGQPTVAVLRVCERVRGIEPPYSAWEADVLPLNYTRRGAPTLPARPSVRGCGDWEVRDDSDRWFHRVGQRRRQAGGVAAAQRSCSHRARSGSIRGPAIPRVGRGMGGEPAGDGGGL